MTSRARQWCGAIAQGLLAPGFESVAEAFESNFETREIGAAFAAYVDGVPVVDIWGGVADRSRQIKWRTDTMVGIFSGTKGLVATCLLLLIQRGVLDPDEPVCRYWPEFAAAGKEGILVRDVVCHEAGLPGLQTPVSVEDATDDVKMARLLAAQAPIASPGDGPIYHALTFGWLCGELVRRVDGRSIGRFLREEVADRLGLDVWIGLPMHLQNRLAVLERGAGFGADVEALNFDPVTWSIWANPPRFFGEELANNDQRWHAAEIPASNGIVTARSLARLYACLARGGEIAGTRLLEPEAIELGRRCLARGKDPYLGEEIAFATGFEVQTSSMSMGPPADAFGHSGGGGSMHGAWPSSATGFSYTPNLLLDLEAQDGRASLLLDALHAAVEKRW